MKKVLTALLVAGMFSFYACNSATEEKKTEEQTETAAPATEQPASDAGMQQDTTMHADTAAHAQ